MSSNSEKHVAVALYRRDPISTDSRKRQLYHREAYHWGVVIEQGGVVDTYEATDRNRIHPTTFRQENPSQGWWFNWRQDVDPSRSGKFLGYIIIGTVPSSKADADVKALLEEVPMPKKNHNPQQSCVTWVTDAIHTFRELEWVQDFDVEEFLDWGLNYADERLWNSEGTPGVIHYEKATKQEEQSGEAKKEEEGRETKLTKD